MSATEPRYCPISTLHRELRQGTGSKGRARATVTRRPCTIAGFYRYTVEEKLLGHSPAGPSAGESSRETIEPSLICLKWAYLVVPPRDRAVPMEHRAGSMRPNVPQVRWRAARGWRAG